MFASIIAVLPSFFTGGDAHVSHGGLKMMFDSSTFSLTQTTVLAWYTDVMHEIKPITSGYRLALSYNAIHTTTSLRPALLTNTDSIESLRHILISWKQSDAASEPEKLVYLLDHKYSYANISGSALKGSDAHIVAYLDNLGKHLGIPLGPANLENYVFGDADEDGYGYGQNQVGMGEVNSRTISIKHLVDLGGI